MDEELKFFGTSGVRGFTNVEITPAFTVDLCEAIGLVLKKTARKKHVAIAYDTRYGAEQLSYAAASALAAVGLNVYDCGIIPIGALAHFIVKFKLAGGVMVSGSHMPSDRIGLIPLLSDGTYIDNNTAKLVENFYFAKESEKKRVNATAIGSIMKKDALQLYTKNILGSVDKKIISSRKFRVLVDPCNGNAAGVLSAILKQLDCTVIGINDMKSAEFGRAPEPREETLQKTAHLVQKNNCELGIALDIDADRVVFIDGNGSVVPEDVTGAIFATYCLSENDVCVVPVNSSILIEHVASRYNAKLEYCRIGQPAITAAIKKFGAVYAYEESGKYYFARECLWADGILAAAKMLELLSKRKRDLADIVATLPRFHQCKFSVECSDEKKKNVMAKVAHIWHSHDIASPVKTVQLDGLKHIYSDYSWLMIRASGTEPLIRVYAEAMSVAKANSLAQFAEQLIKKAMAK